MNHDEHFDDPVWVKQLEDSINKIKKEQVTVNAEHNSRISVIALITIILLDFLLLCILILFSYPILPIEIFK